MKNDTTTELEPIEALARHLECEVDDLSEERHECYGLTVFSHGGAEYAVGTDDEAKSACEDSIEQSAWAFNADFICGQCNLPFELSEALKAWQEKECESANDAIVELIEKHCPGGMRGSHSFSEDAMEADGRGHFLASYDGDEIELDGDFYAFRIN